MTTRHYVLLREGLLADSAVGWLDDFASTFKRRLPLSQRRIFHPVFFFSESALPPSLT